MLFRVWTLTRIRNLYRVFCDAMYKLCAWASLINLGFLILAKWSIVMTDEEREALAFQRKRKQKIIRRVVLIGGGVLVFIIGNWSWLMSLL